MNTNAQRHNGGWSPLVVCPDGEIADSVCTALSALGVSPAAVLRGYPHADDAEAVVTRHSCDVLFLDIATDPDTSMAVLPQFARTIPVIAVDRANDANAILRSLRRGASEFLFPPLMPEQVGDALSRIAQFRGSSKSKTPGRIHCIVPGKAGCGASTICAHLAIETKRCGANRVLAADFDSLASSLRFFLKLKTEYHVGNVIQDWKRMDIEMWNRLVVSSNGIHVLSGPETPSLLEMDAGLVLELAAFCREHYDAAFIDTAGMGSFSTHALASAADDVFVVTTNELAALYATRRSIEYLELNGVERSRVKLLVNRYTPSIALKREDVEKALDVPVHTVLANDYASVQAALLDGKPAPRTSSFGRSISQLAVRLAEGGSGSVSKPERPWFRRFANK